MGQSQCELRQDARSLWAAGWAHLPYRECLLVFVQSALLCSSTANRLLSYSLDLSLPNLTSYSFVGNIKREKTFVASPTLYSNPCC